MTVELRISQLKSRNPDALRLAQLSGFAVRLEPTLLRTLRQKFIPTSDPSAEIDLWHSRLVQSRSSSAAVFDVEVLAWLRNSLAQDARRRDAFEVTLQCFQEHPPLHRLEIELNALAVLDPGIADAEIERKFAPLIGELRLGGEAAQRVARWLLQAAPRWHPRVRGTGSAWASLIAASALLDGRRIIDGGPSKEVSGEKLAQALPAALPGTRKLGVIRSERRLRFVAADVPEVATLAVPSYSPLLLLVEQDDHAPIVVDVQTGDEVPLPDDGPVTLRSLLGDAWRIEYSPAETRSQSPSESEFAEAAQSIAPAVEDEGVIVSSEAIQPSSPIDARKVIIVMGGGRVDCFDAIAATLQRMRYLPVMPEHFMGRRNALPAIRSLLDRAAFVVMDAALPDHWIETWFTALAEIQPIPVFGVLQTGRSPSRQWESSVHHAWLHGHIHRYEDAGDLAHITRQRIEPLVKDEKRRLESTKQSVGPRIRVYLSSTQSDLQEFREAAREILLRLDDVELLDLALLGPQTDSPVKSSLDLIDSCDLYVAIVSSRRGHVPHDAELNPSGLSGMELEYKRAVGRQKPVMAFFIESLRETDSSVNSMTRFLERLSRESDVHVIHEPRAMNEPILQAISGIRDGRMLGSSVSDPSSDAVTPEMASAALDAFEIRPQERILAPPDADPSPLQQSSGFSHRHEMLAIGGQLVEFPMRVSAKSRDTVMHSMLLAQLVADHAVQSQLQAAAWSKEYSEALGKIGWIREKAEEHDRTVTEPAFDLYDEVITAFGSMLAKQDLTDSLLIDVLRRIRTTDERPAWLDMVHKLSRTPFGAHFSFGLVSSNENRGAAINLLSCEIESPGAEFDLLRVKLASKSAEIRVTVVQFRADDRLLESIAEPLARKVRPFIASYVQAGNAYLSAEQPYEAG
jgi:hypothetical protein